MRWESHARLLKVAGVYPDFNRDPLETPNCKMTDRTVHKHELKAVAEMLGCDTWGKTADQLRTTLRGEVLGVDKHPESDLSAQEMDELRVKCLEQQALDVDDATDIASGVMGGDELTVNGVTYKVLGYDIDEHVTHIKLDTDVRLTLFHGNIDPPRDMHGRVVLDRIVGSHPYRQWMATETVNTLEYTPCV